MGCSEGVGDARGPNATAKLTLAGGCNQDVADGTRHLHLPEELTVTGLSPENISLHQGEGNHVTLYER